MLQDANKQNAKMFNINSGFYLVQILKAWHPEANIPYSHYTSIWSKNVKVGSSST